MSINSKAIERKPRQGFSHNARVVARMPEQRAEICYQLVRTSWPMCLKRLNATRGICIDSGPARDGSLLGSF